MTYAGMFVDQGDTFRVFFDEKANEVQVECKIGTSVNGPVEQWTYEECDPYLKSKIDQVVLNVSKHREANEQ